MESSKLTRQKSPRNRVAVAKTRSSNWACSETSAKSQRSFVFTPVPGIVMDCRNIYWSDRAYNVGFIFQNDLLWYALLAQQCRMIYASLRTLYCCTSATSTYTKLKFFKSLIMPYISCLIMYYVRLSVNSFNRLRVALDCCVRCAYGLTRYDHVSHLQRNVLGCS